MLAWKPQPGPQTLLLSCPVNDIFYGGARGGGKTFGGIGDWLAHQNKWGQHAKGVWFRRTYPELEEVEGEMQLIFPLLGAVWKSAKSTWYFPNGAKLKLRYIERDDDAARYQGHSYTWMCFDELPTWRTPLAVDKLRATMRSAAGVLPRLISTGNPGGVGQAWVKSRYIEPARAQLNAGSPVAVFEHRPGQLRAFIPSKLQDNLLLMRSNPGYAEMLEQAGPEWLVRGWKHGDWDAEAGGAMLEAAWFENLFDELPNRKKERYRVVLSVDPAEDVGKDNDETGIVIGLRWGFLTLLLYVEACKLLLGPLEEKIETLCRVFGVDQVIVEKKSVGGPLVQNLKARRTFGVPTMAIDPGSLSKAERMWAETPALMGGQLLLPSLAALRLLPMGSDWYKYRKEMTGFTGNPSNKEPDNQVDATSQLMKFFRTHKPSALLDA